MSATSTVKNAVESSPIARTSGLHSSWEEFVQTKLDQANLLLGQLDQAALRQLIQFEEQPVSSDNP